MGKNTKPGIAKNQETSGKDNEASDMAAAPVPLTAEVLVSELEKSRRSLTEEFTALLISSLSPLHMSLESMHSTLASHTATISEMEAALTDHSSRISELESEVTSLKANLSDLMQCFVLLWTIWFPNQSDRIYGWWAFQRGLRAEIQENS